LNTARPFTRPRRGAFLPIKRCQPVNSIGEVSPGAALDVSGLKTDAPRFALMGL